jgi:hypothetical protein
VQVRRPWRFVIAEITLVETASKQNGIEPERGFLMRHERHVTSRVHMFINDAWGFKS